MLETIGFSLGGRPGGRHCVAGFLQAPVPGVLVNVFALVVTLWVLVAGALMWLAADRAEAAL